MAVTPLSNDELLRAAIGKRNTDFYVQRLATNRKISWNWAAFWLTGPWFLYRKLWVEALVYLFVVPFLLISVDNYLYYSEAYDTIWMNLFPLTWMALLLVAPPLLADALYTRRVRLLVWKAKYHYQDSRTQFCWLNRHGGTASLTLILPVLVVAYFYQFFAWFLAIFGRLIPSQN